MKSFKFKIECDDMSSKIVAFNDCLRYSKAKILFADLEAENAYSIIEITPKNPSTIGEALNLLIDRWESCGFKLTLC